MTQMNISMKQKKKKTDTENRLVVVKGEEGSSGLGV